MNLSHSLAIALRYAYLVRGNWTRFVQIFVWAILDIVLWGFITKYLDSVGQSGMSFTLALLGAVILWDFVARAQQGVSTPFLEDIWSRNLLNIFASPITVVEYIVGLTLTSIATSTLGVAAMLFLAFAAFGMSMFFFGSALGAFVLVLFLFGISIGILSIAIVLRFGPSAEWFVWPLPSVMSPFVGVFYPVTVLPAWMQVVAHVLPPTYVFEGLRSVIAGGVFDPRLFLTGLALSIGFLIVASAVFARVYRSAVNNGSIARYGSESF